MSHLIVLLCQEAICSHIYHSTYSVNEMEVRHHAVASTTVHAHAAHSQHIVQIYQRCITGIASEELNINCEVRTVRRRSDWQT